MEGLLTLMAALLRSALALFRGRGQQAIVELALRQQLAVLPDEAKAPAPTGRSNLLDCTPPALAPLEGGVVRNYPIRSVDAARIGCGIMNP